MTLTASPAPPSPAAPHPWRRLRRVLRNRLAESDRLYLPLVRLARPDHAVFPDTELVIEGYPRSANSHLEACAREAWGEDLRIAQHLHAAASLREAARRFLPAILLLRAPEGAAASLVLRDPDTYDPRLALGEYIRFHAGVREAADRLLVVPFGAATRAFPEVAAALVGRFALPWPVPDWTEAQETAARARLDLLTERRIGRAHVSYSPAVPAAARTARQARAAAMRQTISQDPSLAPLLTQASALHAELLAKAPRGLRRHEETLP